MTDERHRRVLTEETTTPTPTPTTTINVTMSTTTSSSSPSLVDAVGVPHEESRNVVSDHPLSNSIESYIRERLHSNPIENPIGKNLLEPILINDDSNLSPIKATTVCDALVERARVTETLSEAIKS